MNIGKINYPHGLFLAPMAGVTDRAFRSVCRKYGAEGLVTEMVSAKALCFGDAKTELLARIDDNERPCSLQIFGSDPKFMAKAAVIAAQKFNPEIIDVNMGCPAPKIAGNGDGSAIMKTPKLAYEIIASMREALDSSRFFHIPVTAKMRSGFDKAHINAVEVAQNCEKGGASAVTVHGRTREQMYAPPVNTDAIRDVKNAVSIPVIANGDIFCAEDAKAMLEKTHCDGLMIGRGSLGNPYIFAEIIAMLCGDATKKPQITSAMWLEDVTFHMRSLCADKGEQKGMLEARKHIAWYIRGIPGAAEMRRRVNTASTLAEMLDIAGQAAEGFEKRDVSSAELHVGNIC